MNVMMIFHYIRAQSIVTLNSNNAYSTNTLSLPVRSSLKCIPNRNRHEQDIPTPPKCYQLSPRF